MTVSSASLTPAVIAGLVPAIPGSGFSKSRRAAVMDPRDEPGDDGRAEGQIEALFPRLGRAAKAPAPHHAKRPRPRVIAGLVPAIHNPGFGESRGTVVIDPRDKPGDDHRARGQAEQLTAYSASACAMAIRPTVIAGLVPAIHNPSFREFGRSVVMDTRDKPGYDDGVMGYFVYILASRKHGTLYVGVTNNLLRRVAEHRSKAVPGFTKKYGVSKLVHFEAFDDPESAIQREKSLKKWPRDWKINLIERENPDWGDLSTSLSL